MIFRIPLLRLGESPLRPLPPFSRARFLVCILSPTRPPQACFLQHGEEREKKLLLGFVLLPFSLLFLATFFPLYLPGVLPCGFFAEKRYVVNSPCLPPPIFRQGTKKRIDRPRSSGSPSWLLLFFNQGLAQVWSFNSFLPSSSPVPPWMNQPSFLMGASTRERITLCRSEPAPPPEYLPPWKFHFWLNDLRI